MNTYQSHFADVVVSVGTAVHVPVVFITGPEGATVPIASFMVCGFVTIPIEFMASLIGESPAPFVSIGVQTVVQTHPSSGGNYQEKSQK
jgi:hypothetical protein